MFEAGSFAAVVPAAEEGAALEVVDFGFAFFESESLERAASSAPVTSRATNGVLRRRNASELAVGEAVERTGSTVADQAG